MMIGPHHVNTLSVELFYFKHANSNRDPAPALANWTWPAQEGPLVTASHGHGRSVYKHLVKNPFDDNLQEELLTNIQVGWNHSKHGVIIATEEFDRIGEDLPSKLDGLGAMKRVVEKLSVTPSSHVEIVLNYRLPRLAHWLSFYEKDSKHKEHYKHYICSGKHHEIWEALESSMNPFKLADTFRKEGWKVYMVDMEGVAAKQLNVAHVLGCHVLGVECKNGWIQGLQNQVEDREDEPDPDSSSLDDKIQIELETMFRYRDCHYRGIMDDPGFKIVQDGSLSSMLKHDCDYKKKDVYKLLANSTFLYNALRTQFGCHDEWIDIAELLGNTTTDGSSTDSDDTEDPTEGEEELVSKALSNSTWGPKVVVPLFLVLLVAVGTTGMFYLQYHKRHQGVQVPDLSAFRIDDEQPPTGDMHTVAIDPPTGNVVGVWI
jgi:hypothetical protein